MPAVSRFPAESSVRWPIARRRTNSLALAATALAVPRPGQKIRSSAVVRLIGLLRTGISLESRLEMNRPNLRSVVRSPATYIAACDGSTVYSHKSALGTSRGLVLDRGWDVTRSSGRPTSVTEADCGAGARRARAR